MTGEKNIGLVPRVLAGSQVIHLLASLTLGTASSPKMYNGQEARCPKLLAWNFWVLPDLFEMNTVPPCCVLILPHPSLWPLPWHLGCLKFPNKVRSGPEAASETYRHLTSSLHLTPKNSPAWWLTLNSEPGNLGTPCSFTVTLRGGKQHDLWKEHRFGSSEFWVLVPGHHYQLPSDFCGRIYVVSRKHGIIRGQCPVSFQLALLVLPDFNGNSKTAQVPWVKLGRRDRAQLTHSKAKLLKCLEGKKQKISAETRKSTTVTTKE